ncbi:Imm1 family immunity protein [Bradyrhizobium sp.]|uniref:Imm1 family immunity protein n=1 Tax=Bradyrhizobium sp. TaxID=376 RepID=UPI003BB21A16
MEITFNGTTLSVTSIEELSSALDRFDLEQQFELWITVQNGPSLAMLRNLDHALLMYLRFNGDSGVVTKGNQDKQGTCAYTLTNGEVNELPLSWCIDLEQCYKAIAYFVVNSGARYDFITWQVA